MAKIKAAVIFGGTAQEHELSLASAAEVIRNIPTDKYEVICIGVTKKGRWLYYPGGIDEIADGSWYLDPDCASAILSPDPIHHGIVTIENGEATIRRIDVAFPIMMGKKGADGTIQGLLDLSGIPYVGCGLLSAASCMDKSHIHMILDDYGIRTADWELIPPRELSNIDERCTQIAEKLGFPLVVKPACSGSSAGTTIANNYDQLVASVKIAFSNDKKVVVEKYLSGRKLEAAVFGYDNPFSSSIGEILSVGKQYDPLEVNRSTGDDLAIPADRRSETQLSAHSRRLAARVWLASTSSSPRTESSTSTRSALPPGSGTTAFTPSSWSTSVCRRATSSTSSSNRLSRTLKEITDKEHVLKNNVLISLTSIQWQDGEKSETELLTKAAFTHENGLDIITYEDTSATGFEGSVTTIKIDGSSSASIVRAGTNNSVLSLEIGRKHFCQYGTPYGNLQIGVYTHAIRNTLKRDGKVYMKYTLDLNSSYLSDNEIIMTVQSQN